MTASWLPSKRPGLTAHRHPAPISISAEAAPCNMLTKILPRLEDAKCKNNAGTCWRQSRKMGNPCFFFRQQRAAVHRAAALKTSKGVVFGYNEERSHHTPHPERPILDPALDAKMQGLRPYSLLPRLLPELKTCDITLQYAGGAFDMVLMGCSSLNTCSMKRLANLQKHWTWRGFHSGKRFSPARAPPEP